MLKDSASGNEEYPKEKPMSSTPRQCSHCERTFDLTTVDGWRQLYDHLVDIGVMEPVERTAPTEDVSGLAIEVRHYGDGSAAVTLFDSEGSLLLMGLKQSDADQLALLLKRHVPYAIGDF